MSTRDRDEEAERVRAWLGDVMRRTGLKPSPLAQQAGISPSTLLRALDPAAPTVLSRASILRIVKALGEPEPGFGGDARAGFGDADIERAEPQPPGFAGAPLTPNQYVARAATRVLEMAGIMPGDEILFDMAAAPVTDDVVAAQIYAAGLGEAITVLRLYDAPYLVTHTADRRLQAKPLVVDGERTRIAAVALKLLRQRSPQ